LRLVNAIVDRLHARNISFSRNETKTDGDAERDRVADVSAEEGKEKGKKKRYFKAIRAKLIKREMVDLPGQTRERERERDSST